MSLDFEEAKAFLQNSKLYDHLSAVLLEILLEKPDASLENFERISALVKEKAGPADGDIRTKQRGISDPDVKKRIRWANATSSLFKAADAEEGEIENFAEQDLLDEASMFEWAGVGFGKQETLRLALALGHLAQKESARGLRLWGKLLGTRGDYYIAEGQVDREEDESNEDPATIDSELNKLTYWALPTSSSRDPWLDGWEKLPDATPANIVAARRVKRFLSGDLTKQMHGIPRFEGTEADFLRAQIARISSATTVCPQGIHEVDEEGVVVEADPESVPARPAEELLDLSNWVHREKEINSLGRSSPLPPTTDEDGNEVENPDEPQQVPPLRPLAEDTENIWAATALPNSKYLNPKRKIAVLKSLSWPGACAIGYGTRFVNIYVGYGQKFSSEPYSPPDPPRVQEECTTDFLEGCIDITEDPTEKNTEEDTEDNNEQAQEEAES